MCASKDKNTVSRQQEDQKGWYLLFSIWLVATVATLGSLYLDKVLGMEPCSLCWFQRVFMYALVPVLLSGLSPLDRNVTRYALPLAILGLMIAFYHVLLYVGIIPETLLPCGKGPSCTQEDLVVFEFLNIPVLSLISFSTITGSLLIFIKRTPQ